LIDYRLNFKLKHPAEIQPGFLTSHKTVYLLLLPSGPDKIHRVLLRETKFSLGQSALR